MDNLIIFNHDGKLVTDSREVAKMIRKNHKELMRSIRGYVEVLETSAKLRPLDFFIENTYKDSKGENRPCYLLTKKGCDMVANKMTGEKGILFTAEYVTQFENMEKAIRNNVLTSEFKVQLENRVDEIVQAKINEIEDKCSNYFRPSAFEKTNISQYIKRRLGINKANEEYELVKQRVLIKLGATKWEDIPIETLKDSLNIIDESIRIMKMDRSTAQTSIFD